jgi:hypothetical protein
MGEPPQHKYEVIDKKLMKLSFIYMPNIEVHIGGSRNPTSGPCSGFREPGQDELWLKILILTNSEFLADKPYFYHKIAPKR